MREFMHYVTNAFYGATGWTEDNSYQGLNATTKELINFPLPTGLRLTLSSLATPNFATSYNLGSVGVVDGSISYLYSTIPLANTVAKSELIPLPALLRSYRQLRDLGSRHPTLDSPAASPKPETSEPTTLVPAKTNTPLSQCSTRDRGSLFYGRLYLPQSLLEGMFIKRLSPALQVRLSAVSEQSLRNGGTILGLVQYDKGNYGVEGLASTDGGLLGVRGLYNFGGDASSPSPLASPVAPASESGGSSSSSNSQAGDRIYGRFSAGAELYYGTLNKSGGMSLGARFATLPAHRGTPLTATLTINPLMGNINATYAVLGGDYCSLATTFQFNVYSYESEWAMGMELWSKRRPAGFLLGALPSSEKEGEQPKIKERSFQAKLEWRLDEPETLPPPPPEPPLPKPAGEDKIPNESYLGVLKARLDNNLRVGLLWEGRVKSLIFSLGSGVDLHKLDEPFRSLGLEVQYSS